MAKKDPIPPRPPRGPALSWDRDKAQREWDKRYGGAQSIIPKGAPVSSSTSTVRYTGKDATPPAETPAQKKAREALERAQAQAARQNAPDAKLAARLERLIRQGNPKQKEDARAGLAIVRERQASRTASQADKEKGLLAAQKDADKKAKTAAEKVAAAEKADADREADRVRRTAGQRQKAEEQAAEKREATARRQAKDQSTLDRLRAVAERARQSGDHKAQREAVKAAEDWARERGIGQPPKTGLSEAERKQNRTGYGGGGGI